MNPGDCWVGVEVFVLGGGREAISTRTRKVLGEIRNEGLKV